LIDLACIDAKGADAAGLEMKITELEGLAEVLDPSDRHHVTFLRG